MSNALRGALWVAGGVLATLAGAAIQAILGHPATSIMIFIATAITLGYLIEPILQKIKDHHSE